MKDTDMSSPYANLPEKSFWRSGVAERAPLEPGDVYQPKFKIPRKSKFATAGSCFAQHIGHALRAVDLAVIDREPFPKGFPQNVVNSFGYGLYSARYGNIYTVRQLLQLLQEAFENRHPADPVWQKDGRFYDALRPGVEPMGHSSADAVRQHRKQHLNAVKAVFSTLDVFVFTFGLTECWISKQDGTAYPTCPGLIAGRFDPDRYEFHNFGFAEIEADYIELRALIKKHNPEAQFVITVSPVALTATASGDHIEVANCYSKSTLRTVCGALQQKFDDVDYFPSYEIITSIAARGSFFNANLRTVSEIGVETAMSVFLQAHDLQRNPRRVQALRLKRESRRAIESGQQNEAEICEESLLQVFAK